MKKALIIGATGMVGKELTRVLLQSEEYDKIILLVRKVMTINNPKLEQYLYDFDNPKPELVKADHLYCCLGTTIKKAGSKDRFMEIDHGYPLATARMGLLNGATLFSLVSSMGANPKSRIFYSRVKGQLEEDLKKLGYPRLHIFRPSLLLGDRTEKRAGESIAQWFMTRMSFLIPEKFKAVEGRKVAEAMSANANSTKAGIHEFNNIDIIKEQPLAK